MTNLRDPRGRGRHYSGDMNTPTKNSLPFRLNRPAGSVGRGLLLLGAVSFFITGCTPTTQQSRPVSTYGQSKHASPVAAGASAATAAAAGGVAGDGKVDVRLLCLAPSPYTNRHDSLRAGYGILVLLQRAIAEHKLPISVRYYDASEFYEDSDKIARAIGGAKVVILGASTWSQGSAFYLRRFLEKAGSQVLLGVSASAWATAGGAHTGGEMVILSTLRSLMGMGAQVFTLGQKFMVFTTDERLTPRNPGYFSRLDIWYMDQFARTIAATAMATRPGQSAAAWADKLGTSPHYFLKDYPPSDQVLSRYGDLQVRLNLASKPDSAQYRELRAALTGI